jgi:uncharacterized RDD family membrane protein YckC
MQLRAHSLEQVKQVKCPKCGFISDARAVLCNKCAYRLEIGGDVSAVERAEIAEAPVSLSWQEELSQRVADFRRRRARFRRSLDPNARIDVGAGHNEPQPEASAIATNLRAERTEPDFDVETPSGACREFSLLESVPVKEPGGGLPALSSPAIEAGEMPLHDQVPGPEPVEIVLQSPRPLSPDAAFKGSARALTAAPLARRFLAGIVDALVLLVAAGLFAGILRLAGGRVSMGAINIAVLGFITLSVLLLYFGLFTALTHSTPGLISMGLEVRNAADRSPPTPAQSVRRALGYLVSSVALMLGFVWALVDSEGLTWHDRMSGTVVLDRDPEWGVENSI